MTGDALSEHMESGMRQEQMKWSETTYVAGYMQIFLEELRTTF
jgi:hypothetical protein